MTFKNFLLNYLSPFYFIVRCLWLILALFTWALLTGILVGSGWSEKSAHYTAIAISLIIIWNAIRPWKIGISYNEAVESAKIIEEKIRNRKN
jgi:hypothetical protein